MFFWFICLAFSKKKSSSINSRRGWTIFRCSRTLPCYRGSSLFVESVKLYCGIGRSSFPLSQTRGLLTFNSCSYFTTRVGLRQEERMNVQQALSWQMSTGRKQNSIPTTWSELSRNAGILTSERELGRLSGQVKIKIPLGLCAPNFQNVLNIRPLWKRVAAPGWHPNTGHLWKSRPQQLSQWFRENQSLVDERSPPSL